MTSWSEVGAVGAASYWNPEQHWFDRIENKFYYAYVDFDRRSMNLRSEDKDIDPKRAAFIQKITDKWELEWLRELDP